MLKTADKLKGRPRLPKAPEGVRCLFCDGLIGDRNAERARDFNVGGRTFWRCFDCFIDLFYSVEPTADDPSWLDLKQCLELEYEYAVRKGALTAQEQLDARAYLDKTFAGYDRAHSIEDWNRHWKTYNTRIQHWSRVEADGLIAYKRARLAGERPPRPELVDFRAPVKGLAC